MNEINNNFIRKQTVKRLAVIILTVLLAALAAAIFINHKPDSPFPDYITKNSSIRLYYPVDLPRNFTINKDFKMIQKDHLLYSISSTNGNNFFINLEPVPPNFSFEQFKKNFLSPDEYTTRVGRTVAGAAGSGLVAGTLTSHGVLILINTPSPDSLDDIKTISHSLDYVGN